MKFQVAFVVLTCMLIPGVWRAGSGEVGEAVKTALKAGYTHIDGE